MLKSANNQFAKEGEGNHEQKKGEKKVMREGKELLLKRNWLVSEGVALRSGRNDHHSFCKTETRERYIMIDGTVEREKFRESREE